MRKILTAATGLVLAALLGSGAAGAVPSNNAVPVPPAPSTTARPPASPGVVASSKTAAAPTSAAPYFTGWYACFNGHVFIDFTDPDGNDTQLNVQVWALRRSNSTWAATWMMNARLSATDAYFWLFPPDVGFDVTDVTYYYFRAFDQTGTWSPWTIAVGNANGTCTLL